MFGSHVHLSKKVPYICKFLMKLWDKFFYKVSSLNKSFYLHFHFKEMKIIFLANLYHFIYFVE